MTKKEATIIAYALQHLNANWNEDIALSLTDIAIDKDIRFLQSKYENLCLDLYDDIPSEEEEY